MKKIILTGMLLISSVVTLFSMDLKVETVWPNQAELTWSPVSGAAAYDVYADGEPFARYDGNVTSGQVGSNEKPLFSNHAYKVIVAARDANDGNLDAAQVTITTGSWSGSYLWKNMTDKDNKGRCFFVRFVLEDNPEGMIIKSDLPGLGLRQISPMPINTSWVDYQDEGAETYRANALMFNTTNFTPSKFKVTEVNQDAFGVVDVVLTKAVGMTFTTQTYYDLIVDEEGHRAVLFETKGTGLAATGIFRNPDKGSDGKFKLVEEQV